MFLFLNNTIKNILIALAKGEDVSFVGFGSFKVTERKERIGRNPKTGAELKIPASKSPKFSAGKLLKEIVNK